LTLNFINWKNYFEMLMLEAMPVLALTYAQFHLFYTLPVALVLGLLVRPFMDASLWVNVLFLSTVALIYTTPWDNFLVATNTWTYSEHAVITTIGYVPLEEYLFFLIQTFIVYLWAVLCLRWTLPGLHLNATSSKRANFIRWTPIPFIVIASVFSWSNFEGRD